MSNELKKFDPFRPMKKMRKDLRGLFDFSDDFSLKFPATKIREPLVDIIDRGKNLEIMAELPGVDKKDVKIMMTGDSVAIKAETRAETKERRKGYYFHERAYNAFCRAMPLPTDVIANKAKAEFKNGLLKLTIPKKNSSAKKAKGFEVRIE